MPRHQISYTRKVLVAFIVVAAVQTAALVGFVVSAWQREADDARRRESTCEAFEALVEAVELSISSIFLPEDPTIEEVQVIDEARQTYYERVTPAVERCNSL